jgi:hypothetical protein
VEMWSGLGEVQEFVCNINPLTVVPKDDTEVRPCLDCTYTGLNLALAPWGLGLPTIEEFLGLLEPHWVLSKRDFRHGFYHIVVQKEHRKYLGFRHPATG